MAQAAKSEHAQKLELVKEIQQLGIKAKSLEQEKATHIFNKRNEFYKNYSQLQETEQKTDQLRKQEISRIIQQVNKIKGMVTRFHKDLKDVKPTPEFVEKIKFFMEDIESHISAFKAQSKEQYEELMKDERFTYQEVMALDKKFDSWAQQGAATVRLTTTKVKPLPSSRDIKENMPPQVKEFQMFLEQTGGIRGGWDDYDHGTFLKFRNRHKGRHTFLRELVRMLPTRTDQEIRDHESWYQQYLVLNDSKKEAIQKWKERREDEKDAIIANADISDSDGDDEEGKKMEKEALDHERHEKRVQLNRWKLEKELERALKEEKEVKGKLEKAKLEEQRRQKQMDTKKKVDVFKKLRQQEEEDKKRQEALRLELEKEDRGSYGKVVISHFQNRDKESLQRKMGKTQEKQQAEEEKKARLERLKQQVEVRVERDPSRLLQPTAGWKERQKTRGSDSTGPVLHMQHRAVPSWRQNMH